jgi:hypothetical protein
MFAWTHTLTDTHGNMAVRAIRPPTASPPTRQHPDRHGGHGTTPWALLHQADKLLKGDGAVAVHVGHLERLHQLCAGELQQLCRLAQL